MPHRQRSLEHLTELVRQGYPIQLMNPYELMDALHRSADLRHDEGDTMARDFIPLLFRKLAKCSDYFLSDLEERGIQEPIIIIIRADGTWEIREGHNRLAWALGSGEEVPVFFEENCPNDDDDIDHSRFRRPGIEIYHDSKKKVARRRKVVQDGVVPAQRTARGSDRVAS